MYTKSKLHVGVVSTNGNIQLGLLTSPIPSLPPLCPLSPMQKTTAFLHYHLCVGCMPSEGMVERESLERILDVARSFPTLTREEKVRGKEGWGWRVERNTVYSYTCMYMCKRSKLSASTVTNHTHTTLLYTAGLGGIAKRHQSVNVSRNGTCALFVRQIGIRQNENRRNGPTPTATRLSLPYTGSFPPHIL